jgi:hypothetical protein
MNVLIAMETSGKVREAFRAKGHNAWSCDFLPPDDNSPYHIQCNVFYVLSPSSDNTYYRGEPWDLMIAHPECTYLCVSGLHWNKRRPGRQALTNQALDDVRRLMAAPIDKIAIENPIGCISSKIRKPDQIIQPYQFGHDASKQTCLWLKNLPPLKHTQYVPPRNVNGRKIWGNQTPSGQNKLGPSPDRWKLRSETYSGIAQAMADQWG